MSSDTTTCGFFTREPVTLDLLKSKQFVVGGTAATSGTTRANRVMASVLGLNFKIVAGYRTLGDLQLAAEKGEVQGFCGLMASTLRVNFWDRFKNGALQIPVQAGLEPDPDLPATIPNALDLAASEQDRALVRLFAGPWYYGRPYMTPPNIPADRLAALRKAFAEMHRDPAFLDEAKRIQLNVRPLTGAQVRDAVVKIYETPKDVIERARPIMGPQ
jgi:hypothetical protein